MRKIELRIDWNGKDLKIGEIEFDRMGIDYEIKFSNQIYVEDFDIRQRGFYAYDAGEFTIQWDAIDNDKGELATFYFDTEEIFQGIDVYYIQPFDLNDFNPIAEALKK